MTQQMETPPTDEQITTAQKYLDIRNRREVAACNRCSTPSQLTLGFAEQFAAGRFMTVMGFEVVDYPEEKASDESDVTLQRVTRLSVEDLILSHAKQVASSSEGADAPINMNGGLFASLRARIARLRSDSVGEAELADVSKGLEVDQVDGDAERYKEMMIEMGRRGVFSSPDGAVIGNEYNELDETNGVTRCELVPEVTDIQW